MPYLGGGNSFFFFIPKIGEDEPNLTSIFFQDGLVQPPNQISSSHEVTIFASFAAFFMLLVYGPISLDLGMPGAAHMLGKQGSQVATKIR